ncbi:MAG: sugar-binding transcriptional regulator [Pseudomonadota bacterium]
MNAPEKWRSDRLEDAILDATWAYYHEGRTQTEIAEKLGLSRATVVNYLTEARRREIVRITLDPEVFTGHRLAGALRDRFGLIDVAVVPDSGPETADRVARMTADWLPTLLGPGDMLGVAWGETVYRVAEAAPRLALLDVTIVQLLGSRPAALGFAAETCSATLARRFGAACINLHAPLVLSRPELARDLAAEPGIAAQLDAVRACTKVLFAPGTCESDSHIVQTGLLTPDTLKAKVADGARAVICGRLIDADGAPIPTEIEARMLGISLDDMRAKPMGVMVGSGPDRIAPMQAALRGGFATHLATSAGTAERLLDGE